MKFSDIKSGDRFRFLNGEVLALSDAQQDISDMTNQYSINAIFNGEECIFRRNGDDILITPNE